MKFARVQPRKVRIIADEVRGQDVVRTMAHLRFHTSKGARLLHKVLTSAAANAQENHGLPVDQLRISQVFVDEGPRMKRMQARAMGRGNRILKKTSHITVVVEDVEAEAKPTVKTTPAKKRPTFSGMRTKPAKAVATAPAPEETPAEMETQETPVEEVAEAPVTEEPQAEPEAKPDEETK